MSDSPKPSRHLRRTSSSGHKIPILHASLSKETQATLSTSSSSVSSNTSLGNLSENSNWRHSYNYPTNNLIDSNLSNNLKIGRAHV